MSEPITLTDANFDAVVATDKPVLILVSNGDGVRGDFKVAFNKQSSEDGKMVYALLDPTRNPYAAQKLNVSTQPDVKPVLVAWHCGEEIVRRPRPWGSDLPLALEALQKSVSERTPQPTAVAPQEQPAPDHSPKKGTIVFNKPVEVTDATFETEVLQSDLPVLVDFWAAWCGPCRMVAPILDKLAGEFAGKIKIAKVDVDANPGLSQAFQIRSIPNLMIIKNRTMIFNQPGALPEPSMRNLIQQAIDLEVPTPTETEAQQEPPAQS